MGEVTHATLAGLMRLSGVGGPVVRFKRACDGADATQFPENTTIYALDLREKVPTCPRCAVLRDEALEGRLPARPVLHQAHGGKHE